DVEQPLARAAGRGAEDHDGRGSEIADAWDGLAQELAGGAGVAVPRQPVALLLAHSLAEARRADVEQPGIGARLVDPHEGQAAGTGSPRRLEHLLAAVVGVGHRPASLSTGAEVVYDEDVV